MSLFGIVPEPMTDLAVFTALDESCAMMAHQSLLTSQQRGAEDPKRS